MRSAIVAPLVGEDTAPIGAIVVLSTQRAEYTVSDVAAVATFARFVRHVIAMRASSNVSVGSATAAYAPDRR